MLEQLSREAIKTYEANKHWLVQTIVDESVVITGYCFTVKCE